MRAKLVTIFLVLLGLFIGATVFRVDQMLFSDKLSWSEAQARAQVGSLSEALQSNLKMVNQVLEVSWPLLQEGKKDFPAGKPYSHFPMIAELVKSPSGEWNLENRFYLENSPVKAWAGNYTMLALKGLKGSQIPVGGATVISVLDPNRKVYFFVITRNANQWLAALSGPELFQEIMDRQKGLVSSVFAVNAMGQTLAHTVPEYVGSLLNEDPMVKSIMQSGGTSGSGTFDSSKGSVQGFYEQVPQSNVFVAVSTPISELMGNRKDVRIQLILLGLGFALVGTALLLLVLRSIDLAPPKPFHVPKAPPAPIPVEASEVRIQAFTQAAGSLAHELRGPLLSLLGRLRLLREAHQDSPALQGELLKIEEGAREADVTLRKLLTFSGEKDEPLVLMSLADVIKRSLVLVSEKIKAKGVKLETHLDEVPLLQGQPNLMVKAFEQIFLNSIEAMERAPQKNLTVELKMDSQGSKVRVRDTGEGIGAEHLGQVFDPFFTTKSSKNHSGLGLSLAHGIVRSSGGQMSAQSTRGQSTLIEMVFAPMVSVEAPIVPMSAPTMTPPPAPPEFKIPEVTQTNTLAVPPVDLPEVLNDRTMEKALNMIDALDDVPPPAVVQELSVPPPPPPMTKKTPLELSDEAPKVNDVPVSAAPNHEDFMKFTAKIDKPQMKAPKKDSRLTKVDTEVRRPGDRL